MWTHRGNCCLQIWRDRQVNTEKPSLPDQKSLGRNLCGNHWEHGKLAQQQQDREIKNSRGTQSWGLGEHTFPCRSSLGPSSEYWRNPPLMHLIGEGEKEPFWVFQSILFFCERSSPRRNCLTTAKLLRFYQNLTDLQKLKLHLVLDFHLEEGTYPSLAPSSQPVPPNREWEQKLRSSCEVHSPEAKPH